MIIFNIINHKLQLIFFNRNVFWVFFGSETSKQPTSKKRRCYGSLRFCASAETFKSVFNAQQRWTGSVRQEDALKRHTRLCLRDHGGTGLKSEREIIHTCLKVVWGAASAPVSSRYSSQLNSASSSMESAGDQQKNR